MKYSALDVLLSFDRLAVGNIELETGTDQHATAADRFKHSRFINDHHKALRWIRDGKFDKKLSEILLRDFEVGFLLIEIMKFFNLKLRISLKKIIIIEKKARSAPI